MRELNSFNKVILEKFASRQAYAEIKGHYIPIIMNDISDESVMEVEKRKYYIQSYTFTMLGFLIDENEFEVTPAVSRVLSVVEFDTQVQRKGRRFELENSNTNELSLLFVEGNNTLSEIIRYNTNLNLVKSENISEYEVFINNDYYGSDVNLIQINNGDVLKFEITKNDPLDESTLTLISKVI